MNVVNSTMTCIATTPVEPGANAKGEAGVIPAGVLAGFGDLLLMLLAAPRQDEAVAVDVLQGVLGGRAAGMEGGAPVVQAMQPGPSEMDVIATGACEAGEGWLPPAAAYREQGDPEAWGPAGDPDLERDPGGARFPRSTGARRQEKATGGGTAASERPAPIPRPADPAEAGGTGVETAVRATGLVDPVREAAHDAGAVLADDPVQCGAAVDVETVMVARVPATPPEASVGPGPGSPTAAQVRREKSSPEPVAGPVARGAVGVRTKKAAPRDAVEGPEPAFEAVLQRRVGEDPNEETRPVAGGDDAAPTAGEMHGGRPGRPVRVREIAREIVQHGRMLKYPERTEVEIRLKPQLMGRVTLKVASQEGRVSARFIVAESGVKAEIESRLSELRHEMSEQGLDIGEISVSLDGGRQAPGHGGWASGGGRAGGEWTTDSVFETEGAQEVAGHVQGRVPAHPNATLDVLA